MNKEERKKRGKKALLGVLKFLVLPLGLLLIFNWKIGLGTLLFFLVTSIYRIKRRKYFTKDIHGEKLGFKEFMKRWKRGIEGITPLQQARTSLLGNWIVLSGVLGGMIINALVRMGSQWMWIEVVLLGSLVLVVIQMIGGFQRYWKFKETDKIQKQFEEDLKKINEPIENEVEVKKEEDTDGIRIEFNELGSQSKSEEEKE